MADWRVAESLETLLAEVNAKWPNRNKASDGAKASAQHTNANPTSDHEPRIKDGAKGVVTARDFTHDPDHGLDSQKLAEALVASKDSRIKYIISNRRICSGTGQEHPAWVWREYKGVNPHNHHVHISVKPDKALYDSTQSWGLGGVAPPGPGTTPGNTRPVIGRGSTGPAVRRLQELIGFAPVNGRFDERLENAVKALQERAGIVADGEVSVQTWELVEKGQ
jgi:hypothetical protein